MEISAREGEEEDDGNGEDGREGGREGRKGGSLPPTDNMQIKPDNISILMQIKAYKHSILMHVIIFLDVYLSFYETVITISKYINLGLIMIN